MPLVLPARDPATYSPAELVATRADPEELARRIRSLSRERQLALRFDWPHWRRPSQTEPSGPWRWWMYRGGRGTGKTRTGAEALRRRVRAGVTRRSHIIGATASDVRDVMVEGPTGILAICPRSERPTYQPSKRRLVWPNGALTVTFSADEPNRLRGPQCDFAWGDEAAAWRYPEAFDNMDLGLRLGAHPQGILTTTPKPLAWLKALEAMSNCVVTTGSTYENAANLPDSYLEALLMRYEGTRFGAQELHALYLADVEGALWQAAVLERERWSAAQWGALLATEGREAFRIVVAVDPPGETAECGIVVAAAPRIATPLSHAYVLDDRSLAGRPEEWGAAVVATAELWAADVILVESNQGGDMVRSTIHAVRADAPVRKLRASESKASRAEPVAALSQRGRVHLVGTFGMLEAQLTTWVPNEGKSPDRLDAFVHAITDLLPTAPPPRATHASPASAPALPALPGRPSNVRPLR